jgi:nicotinate-nucleotide adenylyltransferase
MSNGHATAARRPRLAFFGGSFDPPHAGHLAVIRAVLDGHHADRVIVAPKSRPPHKAGVKLTPFGHRLAMLHLATAGLPAVAVSDIEMDPAKSSFTFDTLSLLSAQHPEAEVVLLIGADSLRQLHTWRRAPELVERWPVLAHPRPGETVTLDELRQHWPEPVARRLLAGLLPALEHDVSATAIRAALARGENPADLLPPGVGEYILRHGLYRDGQPAPGRTKRKPHRDKD